MVESAVEVRSARRNGGWFVAAAALIAIVLVFAVRRGMTDFPNVLGSEVPPEGIDREYALHPVLAMTHIGMGVVYLLGAPFQLWQRFRMSHYPTHRRVGRVLATLAIVSGVAGIVFGARYAFGGPPESAATLVFGSWFVASVVLAVRAIRRGDVVAHRRWMIRAFLMGLAVGTIRLWVGLLSAVGALELHDRFAVAFWLAFVLHALVAEWWLATRPHPAG
jgi:uncharacterized membrane protein YozB (DUF420 family)